MLIFQATGVSAAEPEPMSFLNDVMPTFTRLGCNMGACHGKLAGQNGFKLSLRGFAPEQDHAAIVREENGRRLSRVAPEQSLLVLKGSGLVPHAGGKPLVVGSPEYHTLVNWIRSGSPGPLETDPRVVKLEMEPAAATLVRGSAQPLKVTAVYANEQRRDVTSLTLFESNDGGIHAVSPQGIVTAARHGETAVRAAFDGFVVVSTFTTPFENEVKPELYAERRNLLDEHVFNKLRDLRIEPSAPCDDATFLRRAMLDTLGTLPTADETRAFLADNAPDKRAKLVEAILDRPEFADFWALQLGDVLQNRKERDHDVRGAKGVRAFHAWLRQQLAANKSWKTIASTVLTATGDAFENPAVGYYIVTVGEKRAEESEVADSVAQAFLGARIACARCHNHPLERYTQDDYYHFVAFFSRVALDRKNPADGATQLLIGTEHTRNLGKQRQQEETKLAALREEPVDEDKRPEQDQKIAEQEKKVASLTEQILKAIAEPVQARQPRTGKMMKPQPLDRSPVTFAAAGDPRTKLVDWMLSPNNEQFAGAMANRLWRHFFSVGLVEPVDDLRATNPPSNRPLWDTLVKEFTGHDYDLKHVMRLILNSRAYQLAADTKPGNTADHRFYSHYYPRRLQAEVLLDAISQATGMPESFPGYPQGMRAIQLPGPNTESYFLTAFGRSDRVTACACERNGDVSLSQLLHLQNAEALQQKIASGDGRLGKLLAAETDNQRVLDELFLTTYARLPTKDEQETLLADGKDSAARATLMQDILWALLNSKEFSFNR